MPTRIRPSLSWTVWIAARSLCVLAARGLDLGVAVCESQFDEEREQRRRHFECAWADNLGKLRPRLESLPEPSALHAAHVQGVAGEGAQEFLGRVRDAGVGSENKRLRRGLALIE